MKRTRTAARLFAARGGCTLLLLLMLLSPHRAGSAAAPAQDDFEVVVVGGTPGGIAAAITAVRLGHTVALLEYHNHLGGMSASGLGKDRHRDARGRRRTV